MTPENGSYVQPNDVLRCSAESNPPPSFYQWFDSDDEVIDFGNTLVIPEECVGVDELCVTCLALNEMRGEVLGQGMLSQCYNSTGMYMYTHMHLQCIVMLHIM